MIDVVAERLAEAWERKVAAPQRLKLQRRFASPRWLWEGRGLLVLVPRVMVTTRGHEATAWPHTGGSAGGVFHQQCRPKVVVGREIG